MTTFSTLFTNTRTTLVKREDSAIIQEFDRVFNLRPGDYLEIRADTGDWRPCRIEGVESCYVNRGGGFTAKLKVMRLLRSGRIGVGRTVTIVRFPGGKLGLPGSPGTVRREPTVSGVT